MNFNFKEMVQSKIFTRIILGLGVVLILAVIFQAGVFTGLEKAEYSGRLGENYERIFTDNGRPPMMNRVLGGTPMGNLAGNHGAVGMVIKVSSSTLVVAEPNNLEKIISVNDKTIIRKFRDQILIGGIQVGDSVSILGGANDKGEIVAQFIRVMPKP